MYDLYSAQLSGSVPLPVDVYCLYDVYALAGTYITIPEFKGKTLVIDDE